jgi:hypothetical protein
VFEHGRIVFDGPTDQAIERYLHDNAEPAHTTYTAPADPRAPRMTAIHVRTSQGGHTQQHGAPLEVTVEIASPLPLPGAQIRLWAVNRLGRVCLHAWMADAERTLEAPGRRAFVCRFPRLRLAPGQYTVAAALVDRVHGRRDWVERVCPFEVLMPSTREGGWPVNEVAYFEDAQWSSSPLAARAELEAQALAHELT